MVIYHKKLRFLSGYGVCHTQKHQNTRFWYTLEHFLLLIHRAIWLSFLLFIIMFLCAGFPYYVFCLETNITLIRLITYFSYTGYFDSWYTVFHKDVKFYKNIYECVMFFINQKLCFNIKLFFCVETYLEIYYKISVYTKIYLTIFMVLIS